MLPHARHISNHLLTESASRLLFLWIPCPCPDLHISPHSWNSKNAFAVTTKVCCTLTPGFVSSKKPGLLDCICSRNPESLSPLLQLTHLCPEVALETGLNSHHHTGITCIILPSCFVYYIQSLNATSNCYLLKDIPCLNSEHPLFASAESSDDLLSFVPFAGLCDGLLSELRQTVLSVHCIDGHFCSKYFPVG